MDIIIRISSIILIRILISKIINRDKIKKDSQFKLMIKIL